MNRSRSIETYEQIDTIFCQKANGPIVEEPTIGSHAKAEICFGRKIFSRGKDHFLDQSAPKQGLATIKAYVVVPAREIQIPANRFNRHVRFTMTSSIVIDPGIGAISAAKIAGLGYAQNQMFGTGLPEIGQCLRDRGIRENV